MSSSKRVTSLKAAGGFVLAAAVAGMAVAAGPATTVKRPAVAGFSDATKARLKGAGLDAADPGLATKLETTVYWHYGAAESLSYTVEWQLHGPGGQRPLLTMPLGGPCDS